MPVLNESLRLCLFSAVEGALQLNDDQLSGTYRRAPKYQGSVSEAFNILTQIVFGSYVFNYTAVKKDEFGALNTTSGLYDENSCGHSMQFNISDLGFGFTLHPITAKNLVPFAPYFGDDVYILTRYNVSSEVRAADFVKAFADIVSVGVVICFFMFTFAFWCVRKFYVKFINQGQRDNSLYEVLTHLFQVESVAYEGAGMRATSILISLLSFYVITYFTLSMKTDIVVVPEPFIVRSYDDLLSLPRVKILFPQLIDNSDRFEFAEPGTRENRLWQKSLDEFHGDRSKLFLKFGGDSMMQVMRTLKAFIHDFEVLPVGLVSEMYVKSARKLGCIMKVLVYRQAVDGPNSKVSTFDGSTIYSTILKDSHAKEYIMSMTHSAYYKSPYLKVLYKRGSWAYALGMTVMMGRMLDRPPLNLVTITNQKEGDIYRACLAADYRDNLPHLKFAPFAMVQFTTLGFIYALLVSLALLCLCKEAIKHRRRRALRARRKMRRQLLKLDKVTKTWTLVQSPDKLTVTSQRVEFAPRHLRV